MPLCVCCHLPITGDSNKELVEGNKWAHKACPRAFSKGLCSICLEEGDMLERTPCDHTFHHECLATWRSTGLLSSSHCPVCRTGMSEWESRRMNPPRASVKRNYTSAEEPPGPEDYMVPYLRRSHGRRGSSWENPIVIE